MLPILILWCPVYPPSCKTLKVKSPPIWHAGSEARDILKGIFICVYIAFYHMYCNQICHDTIIATRLYHNST